MEIENIKKEDIKAIQYAIARADDRKFFYIYGANNFDLALKHVDNFLDAIKYDEVKPGHHFQYAYMVFELNDGSFVKTKDYKRLVEFKYDMVKTNDDNFDKVKDRMELQPCTKDVLLNYEGEKPDHIIDNHDPAVGWNDMYEIIGQTVTNITKEEYEEFKKNELHR